MSTSHLSALEKALTQHGWRIVATHAGDGQGISGSWEIERSTKESQLLLDFEGMEPMSRFCLPLEESYGCHVRGHQGVSLYFRRKVKARRELWTDDVNAFIRALDELSTV